MKEVTFLTTWTHILKWFGVLDSVWGLCGIFFSYSTDHQHLLLWYYSIFNFFFIQFHHFAPVQKMKACVLPIWHAIILIQEIKPVRPSPTLAVVEMKITFITWMIVTVLAFKVGKLFIFSHYTTRMNNSKGRFIFYIRFTSAKWPCLD